MLAQAPLSSIYFWMASLPWAFAGQDDGILLQSFQEAGGRFAVMALAGHEQDVDGATLGIDQGVELIDRSAARTPHAAIVLIPLFPVAPY